MEAEQCSYGPTPVWHTRWVLCVTAKGCRILGSAKQRENSLGRFNYLDLFFRQPVQLVHELVNLSIRRVNLTLVQLVLLRPDRFLKTYQVSNYIPPEPKIKTARTTSVAIIANSIPPKTATCHIFIPNIGVNAFACTWGDLELDTVP